MGCEESAPTPPAVTESVQPDTPAESTDAVASTLPRIDLAGLEKLIAEADERDQVLVIDFWATWCPPCVAMFPTLHDGLVALGDRVRPVTVTLDSPGDYEAKAIAFLDRHHARQDAYLLVPDTDAQLAMVEKLGDKWNDLVVPAILVYDQKGKLAGEFLDGVADPILARVRELVGAAGEPAAVEQSQP